MFWCCARALGYFRAHELYDAPIARRFKRYVLDVLPAPSVPLDDEVADAALHGRHARKARAADPALDALPIEEEAIGTSGSSCNYPTVHVQVLAFNPGFIDTLRNAGPLETISGVGDEAYFRNNKDIYAEIMVRVGPRMLTLQADGEGKMDTVKPQVIELAKLYVAALR